jgi:hypothetical protein
MSAITTDDILERARLIMSDPARVVLDPVNLYEDAAGERVDEVEDATRCCFIGAFNVAAHELGGSGYAAQLAVEPYLPDGFSYTGSLEDHGAAGCVKAIEAAQAARAEV